MTGNLIARALYEFILERSRAPGTGAHGRLFFRLEGLTDAYPALIDMLQGSELTIGGRPAIVRTTGPIAGYESFALEPDKTATWYRNNLQSGQVLLLLSNKTTSDAQSLKDIFPITETVLADGEGLRHLIRAAFRDGYQLTEHDDKVLRDFLSSYQRTVHLPQLRDLARFLGEVNHLLIAGEHIERAIAQCLPYLGLFRYRELAEMLGSRAKTERALRELYRGASFGNELLAESEQRTLLERVKEDQFDDESAFGGLAQGEKCTILRQFLTRALTDETSRLAALGLDWSEVNRVLFKPPRKTQAEKLQDLAQALQRKLPVEDLPDFAQDVIRDLGSGQIPAEADLDRLAVEEHDQLGKPLTRRLRQLVKSRSYPYTDFIAGITIAAVELLTDNREDLAPGATLKVTFQTPEELNRDTDEALLAFRCLYDGIEAMFPSVVWEIDDLWSLIQTRIEIANNGEEPSENEKSKASNLEFRMTLCSQEEREIGRAEIVWQYPSDSPAASVYRAIKTVEAISQSSGPFIPIFTTHQAEDEINDLDLHHPVRTLGAWFDKPGNLRLQVAEALNKPSVKNETRAALEEALSQLESRWSEFVSSALAKGLLGSDVSGLLDAYEKMLETATSRLQSGQETFLGFRALAKAWIIGPENIEDWAVVPLLHPLKLLWWRNRGCHFSGLLTRLLNSESPTDLVDVVRFRRGLAQTYSSANFPAVLVLPSRTGQPVTFVPLNEVEGFELFRPEDKAGAAQGLDSEMVPQQEADEESAKAAGYLASVVNDYILTFPFVRDGIEIYLIGCSNGALPGQLVEQISRYEQRRSGRDSVHVSVVVHTPDRGAPIFCRVTEWLKAHEEFTEAPATGYFPPVSLRVLECSYEQLPDVLRSKDVGKDRLRLDIAILPDVLSERGQKVQQRLSFEPSDDVKRDDFLPFLPLLRSQPMPFERGEMSRVVMLNPTQQPTLVRNFYNIQWGFRERQAIKPNQITRFELSYSLDAWSELLKDLHYSFNWVVCYDNTIDRFLLEDTFPSDVQVIRYSTGLGTKGRQNLTVSSSYWAEQVVNRRLATRLRELFPAAPEEICGRIAQSLIAEAEQISGDIVLRAAGPGAYINELIGLVLAKHISEHRYLQDHPGALTAWIYLDDFEHWFDGKYPDLLLIAIPPEANGEMPLHVEVIEAKCVDDSHFDREAVDAERQVERGVNRLFLAMTPNQEYLDADYWYDQIYRAMVSNLMVQREQMRLWDALRVRMPKGNFSLNMSGHSWAFCYDGPATTIGDHLVDEGPSSTNAEHAPDVPIWHHFYGRRGLVEALKSFVEDWNIETPQIVWQQAAELTVQTTESVSSIAPSSQPTTESGVPTSATESAEPNSVATTSPDTGSDLLREQAHSLDRVLRQYSISAFPIDSEIVDIGPSILRYKVRLRPPEKDKRLQNIASDLARELALHDVPLIERLPGTQYMTIDIPRPERQIVQLLPALPELPQVPVGLLPFLVGKTPNGLTVINDLSQLPHLLVAGTTGSGKTVFLYSLLVSLIDRFRPAQLSILLIDPKQTDFVFFSGLPHLRGGQILTDPQDAIDHLRNLTSEELDLRTELFNQARVTKLSQYNERNPSQPLAPIVVVVDEYADLVDVMDKTERATFEREFRRLAQRARSIGIHLVISTQRPSADIVTTSLKTNLPARIAFRLPAHHDSMTVLDQAGAENLLGKGDMLFSVDGRVERLQGFYISTTELEDFLREHR